MNCNLPSLSLPPCPHPPHNTHTHTVSEFPTPCLGGPLKPAALTPLTSNAFLYLCSSFIPRITNDHFLATFRGLFFYSNSLPQLVSWALMDFRAISEPRTERATLRLKLSFTQSQGRWASSTYRHIPMEPSILGFPHLWQGSALFSVS